LSQISSIIDERLFAMQVVLISTYELGRQPFGVAQLAGWLGTAGVEPPISVTIIDTSVQKEWLDTPVIAQADVVGFSVPMHTATRLAVGWFKQVKQVNATAKTAFFGLYAPMNEAYLRELGVDAVFGGEMEGMFLNWVRGVKEDQGIVLERLAFVKPERGGMPALSSYAHLQMPDGSTKLVGYTEASRGCKHKCRHCPVVPIYQGRFFVVQPDIVMADIVQQVAMGARHITFGDPDFFNGIRHAVGIVNQLHQQFPYVTYDVTIKVEHLLKYAEFLPVLRDTGCLFVTCAVESFDDHILDIFDKGHTFADFKKVVHKCREIGLTLNPTFVTFTPWTTLPGYFQLLQQIRNLELVENVTPIQYAIRLLVPNGSWLVEHLKSDNMLGDYDAEALSYRWQHPDPRMDCLHDKILDIIKNGTRKNDTRHKIFNEIWCLTQDMLGNTPLPQPLLPPALLNPVPQLSEPWY
jgi:radical SAM superfamily enzyme YgiQ (UPF0313 family)